MRRDELPIAVLQQLSLRYSAWRAKSHGCAGKRGASKQPEFAEACGVAVRWSYRTGVCHNSETTLIAGSLDHNPHR